MNATRSQGRRSTGAVARGAILFVLLLSGLLLGGASVRAADPYGAPVPGRHIYDRSGLLTHAEIAHLEGRAAAVQRADAPVAVYLQVKEAGYAATAHDAQALMDRWDVESRPGAKDGLVIFLNLKPGNPRHGQVTLYAGSRHTGAGGPLPRDELQRIYADVMQPLLAQGRTAAGIGAGLDAVQSDLVYGPLSVQQPDPAQRAYAVFARGATHVLAVLATVSLPFAVQSAAATFAGGPMNPLAMLVTVALALWAMWLWRARARPVRDGAATVAPPNDLAPAAAGALVKRGVDDAQAEATILDLARRGALAIEPASHRRFRKKAQVRLRDYAAVRDTVEDSLWRTLTGAADPAGVVSPKKLSRMRKRKRWAAVAEALRSELQARGLFDPRAKARRRLLHGAGVGALLLAVAALVVAIIGAMEGGALTVVLLALAGIMILRLGAAYPETTAEGEQAAALWRGYRAGLRDRAPDLTSELNLDDALPYAVAMEDTAVFDKRLAQASAAGYVPAWLGWTRGNAVADGEFYPYWIAFHSSVSSSSASSTSSSSGAVAVAVGGGGGGGASAGGACAGGGF